MAHLTPVTVEWVDLVLVVFLTL